MADTRADFEADAALFGDLPGWTDNIMLLAAQVLVVLLLVAWWLT